MLYQGTSLMFLSIISLHFLVTSTVGFSTSTPVRGWRLESSRFECRLSIGTNMRRKKHLAILHLSSDDYEPTTRLTTALDRPVLAAVDTTALLLFAGVGKASHDSTGSLDVGSVVVTALPFLVAWFATSPWTGVYANNERPTSESTLLQATLSTIVRGWIVAIPLGIILRGVIKGYLPPVSFVVVSLVATLLILCVARLVFYVVQEFFVELVN